MNDAFDNRGMSHLLTEIYSDPKRHKFSSEYGMFTNGQGRIVGRKTICFHCGMKKKGHAEKDEAL